MCIRDRIEIEGYTLFLTNSGTGDGDEWMLFSNENEIEEEE